MLVREVYLMRPSPQKPTEEDLSSGARISSRLRPISNPLRPQCVRFWSIWGGGDGAINHTCSISLIWRPDEPFYPFWIFHEDCQRYDPLPSATLWWWGFIFGRSHCWCTCSYEFLREPNLCGSQYVPLYQARSWVPEGFRVDIGLTRCRDSWEIVTQTHTTTETLINKDTEINEQQRYRHRRILFEKLWQRSPISEKRERKREIATRTEAHTEK